MRWLFIFLLSLVANFSFSQVRKLPHSVAAIEKKGAINKVLDDDASFTFASSNFTVSYARCEWNIDPASRYISGSVTYYFTITKDAAAIIFDLDNILQVDSVKMHNSNISFSQGSNKTLTLTFPQPVTAQQKDSLSIYYRGAPASNGFGSFTQATHNNGTVPVLWTLSEPYGARDWWPCRNGLDDKIDSLDIYISHPSTYSASANGLLTDTFTKGTITTSHFKHRYPIATYLVGIAVTNYTTSTKLLSLQHGTLPVTTTVYPEYADYFQTYVPSVYNALQLYDKYFGDYPFLNERYGQTEWDWGGGMEHQTNSFITNADEYLMAHELGHQWFGDKITLGSWQDIWLNEGFATYLADIFYTEHFHPENLSRIVAQDMALAANEADGSVWVEDTTDVDRIFSDELSYKKGAMLLRTLRWILGDEDFFTGVNLYAQDSLLRYQFARTADLQRDLEKGSNKSLDTFFAQWFYGKGYPTFHATWNWKQNRLRLKINETTSDASNPLFSVPLQVVFKNKNATDTVVVNINQNNTDVAFPLSFQPDSVLIDPSQYLISKFNTSKRDTTLIAFPSIPNNSQLVIYPNPAKTFVYVKLKASDSANAATVRVTGASGAMLYFHFYPIIYENLIQIPVMSLASGVYFITIEDENGKLTKAKFVKQ